jgi:hypothetical protein
MISISSAVGIILALSRLLIASAISSVLGFMGPRIESSASRE